MPRAKKALTEREKALFGPRDMKEEGSVEWCWQTLDLLKNRWEQKTFTDKKWQDAILEIERHRIYEKIPTENPYGSLDVMLKAEIGHTREEAERELLEHGGDRRSAAFREKQGNNVTLNRGNRNAYLRARLERDHPEILEALEQGRYRSVRAAAIAAGIVRVPTPLEVAKKAYGKLSHSERQEFWNWVEENDDP
jgi:hypothetical protein